MPRLNDYLTSHMVSFTLGNVAMRSKSDKLNVSHFKTHALQLLDTTWKKGKCFTITKKGIPIAQVIPFETKKSRSLRGSLKNLAEIRGDIVHFDSSDDWDALKP